MTGFVLQLALVLLIGVLIGRLWEDVTKGSRAVLTYRVGDEVTRVVVQDPKAEVVQQVISLLAPDETQPTRPQSPISIKPQTGAV